MVLTALARARWLQFAAIVSFVCLTILVVLLFRNFSNATSAREQAVQSQRDTINVIMKSQLLLSAVQDLETGQRGYLLTANPNYLEPWQQGEEAAPRLLATLKALTRDNPVQQRNLYDLAKLIDIKREISSRSIDLAQSGNMAAALTIVRSGDGKNIMDAIRVKAALIADEENRLLFIRTAKADRMAAYVQWYLNLSAILGLILLLIAVWATVAGLRARELVRINKFEHKREQQVREDRDLLQSVIDSSPDPIFVKDLDGRFVLANQRTAEVFGVERAAIPGKIDSDFVSADVAASLAKVDQAIIADGRTRIVEERVPQGGVMRTFLSSKTPWRKAGAMAGVIGIAHDITERKAAETALETLNNELEARVAERTSAYEAAQLQVHQMQKLDALGQLTSGIAHDFNNILAAIGGGFALIEKKTDDEYVTMIANHCKAAVFRGAKLVKQMLAFARQEVLAPTNVELAALFNEIEPLIRQAIPGNIIVFDVPDDLPAVTIDPVLLEAAFLNLAGNANDAMPGGGTLTITAKHWGDDASSRPRSMAGKDVVVITVRDTGSGMPPDVLRRVTEPFFTTKAPGKGTGLGLAMVHGFITQSGGEFRVESEVGLGTTVTLYIPCSNSVGDQIAAQMSATAAMRGSGAVLLVDDDADLRPMITMQLQELGYLVTEAADFTTALEHIDAGTTFDIVLSDVVMAGGDGIILARALRQRHPHLPILFMTGRAESERLTGETVIYKPFDQDELANALHELLDAKELEKNIIESSDDRVVNIR